MKRLLLAAAAAFALPAAASAAVYLPSYGSPNSSQFTDVRIGLDVQSIAIEGPGRFDVDGDADTIGGAVTFWDGGTGPGTDGMRYEGRYQKAWRPFEGQRTRLIIDAPLNIITVDGESATTFTLSAGLEFPINDNWSLTPRVSYSAAWASNYFGGNGEVLAAGVASRYRFAQVGRGDLVLGNLIEYTNAGEGLLVKNSFITKDTNNWVYRNGIAYQFPMKSMVFGRQASARVSYTRTDIGGGGVFMDAYNEVAANLGVRSREATAKNAFELLRFGVIYTWGQDVSGTTDYSSGTATVGYRF